ncbi:MAG: ABC transporter permease [Bryobacteraceae bacterium]
MFRDLRFGIRILPKEPGFAATAVFSLALEIGASTVMFSVIYGVVLNPFPYKDVDSLVSVVIWQGSPAPRIFHTADQILEIAERNSIFSRVAASTNAQDVIWLGSSEPQRLSASYVNSEVLAMLGVQPLLGRATLASDFAPGAPPVCILSHKFCNANLAATHKSSVLRFNLTGSHGPWSASCRAGSRGTARTSN